VPPTIPPEACRCPTSFSRRVQQAAYARLRTRRSVRSTHGAVCWRPAAELDAQIFQHRASPEPRRGLIADEAERIALPDST